MACSNFRTINQPLLVPFLYSISKSSATKGDSTNLVYINGKNFMRNSTVMMGDFVCYSLYNGSSVLGFLIPWNKIKTGGNYTIQVINPSNTAPNITNESTNSTKLLSNIISFTVVLS
jgi:bacillopeptidase F (M6 metalloprotease family)